MTVAGASNGRDIQSPWPDYHSNAPYRQTASEDYRALGGRRGDDEDDRTTQRFSLEDVERILRASGVKYRAMDGGSAPLAPGLRRNWIAPLARKAAWVLYVRGGQAFFWSGVVAVLFMLGWKFGEWLG